MILRVSSRPFAEQVLCKNAALNDYFLSPYVEEPRPSKLRFPDKSAFAPSSNVVQADTHNMKLPSAVLFKVVTDLEILRNRVGLGSKRGLVATIRVTKIATNLS
jgi:hypothetical protein